MPNLSKLTLANQLHIRHVLKCDSTQDGYTSLALLLAVAVHKLLVIQRSLITISVWIGLNRTAL